MFAFRGHGCQELHVPGILWVSLRLRYAALPGTALSDTLEQREQSWPAVSEHEGIEGLAIKAVNVYPKELGGGMITLNHLAVKIDEKIAKRGAVIKASVKGQVLDKDPLIGCDLLALQVKFHLVNLKLMQQLEGVFRMVRVAGKSVKQAQCVNAHRPMAGCRCRASLQLCFGLVSQLSINTGFISDRGHARLQDGCPVKELIIAYSGCC